MTGLLSRAAERRTAPAAPPPMREATSAAEVFGTDADPEPVLTPEDALAVSAVYACVRLLSDTIATLPLDAFLRVGTRRREIAAPPAWVRKPNPDMGRIAFLGMVMTSLLLTGNAYILVSRDRAGRVVALDVIPTHLVHPRYARVAGRRVIVYELSTTDEDGIPQVLGVLGSRDVLHLRGLPLAGSLTGVSPIRAAAVTVGLALNAQDYGYEFFGGGALPGAVVSVPGTMTAAGLKAARATWRTIHGGRGNRHGLAVLTEGATFNKISISPDEAQFLETRAFQVPEIARLFGVPPHLIADASGSTSWGSGLAEQDLAFAKHSVRPWVERIEEALSELLAADLGQPNAFVKFGLDAMARASVKDRYEAYRVALNNGMLTRNEVRALEDLSPDTTGYGDHFLLPSSLALVGADGVTSLAASPVSA
ncbi:HK97 family phage portal protein [Actinokineospora baliensis]|uniref:phage portal protein n=1 Tax=Actinokineospora baliensis TaxID=547056 RepID=UPI001957AF5A|nr:phage portal protein [Actinokineospora baliensis]MBM7770633.1 HK97 family phage portal protein [Actinokineospora baliensis]